MDQKIEVAEGQAAGKISPPYLSFQTFMSVIEILEKGMPHQLDKSLFRSFSGTVQWQILVAFKFLGLIDPQNIPTGYLKKYIDNKDKRIEILQEILKNSYQSIFSIGLERATIKQLEDGFSQQYNISGETLRKATGFFLKAVEFSGIPISVYLKEGKRKSSNGRKRANLPGKKQYAPEVTSDPSASQMQPEVRDYGVSKTIMLKTGGSMTLTVSVNPFEMDSDDRAFVFEIIDTMKNYDKKIKGGE